MKTTYEFFGDDGVLVSSMILDQSPNPGDAIVIGGVKYITISRPVTRDLRNVGGTLSRVIAFRVIPHGQLVGDAD